jgi:hypothetical protein
MKITEVSKRYKIYDGDLFLFAVDTQYEADEQQEQGFRVVVG